MRTDRALLQVEERDQSPLLVSIISIPALQPRAARPGNCVSALGHRHQIAGPDFHLRRPGYRVILSASKYKLPMMALLPEILGTIAVVNSSSKFDSESFLVIVSYPGLFQRTHCFNMAEMKMTWSKERISEITPAVLSPIFKSVSNTANARPATLNGSNMISS